LQDRASRPDRLRSVTPEETCDRIIALRRQRLTGADNRRLPWHPPAERNARADHGRGAGMTSEDGLLVGALFDLSSVASLGSAASLLV